ncbi:MAG: SRPBCC family protein [Thermomicrobiales bacterium]
MTMPDSSSSATTIPDSPAIATVDRGPDVLARATVVDIPAADLFARLVDPHRHHELDGSGTVQAAVDGSHRLHAGDTFTVKMKMYGLPYRITSTTVAVEENRLVSWRHPAGYVWQWELRPLADGRTEVTELVDFRGAKGMAILKLIGEPKRNIRGAEKTLAGLHRLKG